MSAIGRYYRAGVIFCLCLLAGTATGQSLVGTNAPGTARNYTFNLVVGVTNFSLVVSGSVSRFSYLLVKKGGTASDTNYDFSSTWDYTTNSIYLEKPEVASTNFSIRVRTPTNSLTHTFTVLLRTNTTLFKTAAKPVMKPLTMPATAAWITNGGRHYYRFEMRTNIAWQVLLDATNSIQPHMYLQYGSLPSETFYLKRSINLTNDGFGLSESEAIPGTYYLGLFSDLLPAGNVRYTLRTKTFTPTVLAWDPGLTHDGTLVYTNNTGVTNDYYFKITTINSPVGAWRTALKVTAGEADLYLSRGTLPTPANADYRSTRVGSDGFVLASTQFNPSEDWYIMVRAWTNAHFTLVTGTPYVQDLGVVATDGSSGSSNVTVGPEGMRYFKTSLQNDTQAWRLWLNGATNGIFVKKLGVPVPVLFEQSNAVQMLVVPPYLIGGDQYFVGVNGNPGATINLDSREQSIIDLAYDSGTSPTNIVNTYGYVTYRIQVPPDRIAWQVSTTTTNGNPNVAVRRNFVPNENYNDAFSELPGLLMDSIVLVPPTLSDGTFYVTVYGGTNFHYILQNGTPVITDINYTSATVNDDPTRVGWRFYRAANINQQLGSLGWELFLTNAPPGTRIALHRNGAPSIWTLRTPTLVLSNSYDYISNYDYLQRPAHPLDVWYVGVYNPSNALGSFTLYTRELFSDPISGDAQTRTRSNVQFDRWEFFRVIIPPDVLGWDIRVTNVTSGSPRIVVRKEGLPTFIGNSGWSPSTASAWPSGAQWAPGLDWTRRQFAADGVTSEDGRIHVMGMGRPLDPGAYYVGVLSTNPTPANYTLVNRFIGPGYSIPVIDLNFSGGTASGTLGPREAAYYRVINPDGVDSWKVKLSATSGDVMLVVSTNLIPHIEAEKRVQKSLQTRDEHFVLLPPETTNALWLNTNYLVVIGEGQNPTNDTRIGVGNCSYTLQSVGMMPETYLGDLDTTTLTRNDTLEGGETKGYSFTSAPGSWGSFITLENKVGNPVAVTAGVPRWCDPGEGRGYTIDSYGNMGGISGLASTYGITVLFANPLESLVVKARNNSGNVWPNASYTLKVEPILPDGAGLPFDGGFAHLSNMDPNRAGWFLIVVPPDALGWDVRLVNVTGGAPLLIIARDALAGIPYGGGPTFGFNPSPFQSQVWPSRARWGATKDFTERTGSPTGVNEDGRILTMGMNRPLQPGIYTLTAASYQGTPITCDIITRGIGPGYTIPVRDLAFAGGTDSAQLGAREAAYYRVTVPTNAPSWKVKLTTGNNGEACLIALKDALPNVGAAVSMGAVTNNSAGKKMQRIGNEQYVLMPEAGNRFLIPGTYNLVVASEGRFATNIYNIGTGSADYTITSFGAAPIRNLGLISSQEIYDTNSLEAAEVQLYQFTVSNALTMEVALTMRTGNPVMSLHYDLFPNPGAAGANLPPEQYGHDAGEQQANLVHSTLLVVPNPTNGVYTLAVKARAGLDGVYSNATYVLRVNVQGIDDVAFDGGTRVVQNQPSATWRFFKVNVPPDAAGWDIRLTNVTSGEPRMVVRRDFLPNALSTGPWLQPNLKFNWPSSNSWVAGSDWTRRSSDVNGVSEDNRILAVGMGRPLEPGTYYIGVINSVGNSPMSYTIASRGIGSTYSIPVVDLPFAGGSYSHPGLPPRDAAYYRVIVPTNAMSWKVRLTALSGESMLAAMYNAVPSVDSIPYSESVTNGRGMQKLGNEHFVELPYSVGTNYYMYNPGTNYLAVVSEGLNPPNSSRVGSGPSSFTITSVGALPVHDFGITTPADILYPDALEGGEVKAYQFTTRTGLFAVKVRLEQRVGNPFMSLVQGSRLPDPGAYYQLIGPDYYGNENGAAALFVNNALVTISNPSNSVYSFAVKARAAPPTLTTYPDSSYTIRIQESGIRDLNFDPSLNTNGQSHIATGDLEDNERAFFRVDVPAMLNGQPVVGWELKLAQSSGIAFLRVRKDQLPNDSVQGLMPFTPASAVIVPPYLTNGTWYVEVKGSNSTSFTLTSSQIILERPPFLMPGPDVTGGSPGVTPPDFGDTGLDTNGVPVSQDQSLFLEQGAFHYYAVRVPTNNYGLLRVQLQAISGNPDLYARTNLPPTLHHNTSGGPGSVFDRSMVLPATEYANWVPLDGKVETRLTPGLWYMVVRAADNANARYRLVFSTGTITDVPIHGPQLPLQALAGGDWRYYRVVMPDTVPLNFNVSFSQISGDVAMYVRDTVPPGNGFTANPGDIKTWYTDARNSVTNANYDAPGTYSFASPPIRTSGTYYFGFRAVSDATFTVQITTNGGPSFAVPTIPFYGGTATTNLAPFGTALYRIDVPADGTRWKHTSVHSNVVQLALENGAPPNWSPLDDWHSLSANGALNVALRGWPWIPNTYFFLAMTNTSNQPQTVTFNMNGKNAQTDDDDNDGILDWWEYYYFGHTSYGAATDPDVDGVSNLDEYLEGTNPNDKTSYRPRLYLNAANGTITRNPNQTNFAMGDSVILTATPNAGYVFAGWSGQAVGMTNPLTVLMDTNKTITATFRLPGDDWAIAYALVGGSATASATNVNYTKEPGEPNHAGNTGGRSVWWKWTAPANAQTTIRTFGSGFPTILGVYTGTVSVSNLTVIASDYNSLGGTNRSQVLFPAVAGTLYSIAVDGFSGSTGTIQLGLTSVTSFRLNSVTFLPNGSARVTGAGAPNTAYVIEASSDLLTWSTFGTVTSDGAGAFSFTDTDAPNSGTRFYRARN